MYTRPLKALCVKEGLNHFMTLYPLVKKKTVAADILLLDKHAALFRDNTHCHLLAKASGQFTPGLSSNQQPPLKNSLQLECVTVDSVLIKHSSNR